MLFDFLKLLRPRNTFFSLLKCVLEEICWTMWENDEDSRKTLLNICSSSWLKDFNTFIRKTLFTETLNLTIFYLTILGIWKLVTSEYQSSADQGKQWWNNVVLQLTSLLKSYLIRATEDMALIFGVQELYFTQCSLDQYLLKEVVWLSYIN